MREDSLIRRRTSTRAQETCWLASAGALVGLALLFIAGCGGDEPSKEPAAADLEAQLAPLREQAASDPHPSHVLYRMGLVFEQHDMQDSARAVYERCVSLDPDFAPAHLQLAQVYHRLGLVQQAVEEYRRTVQLAPGTVAAWNNLGYVLKEQGYLDSSASAYRNAIGRDSTFHAAYNNLAQVLRQQGKKVEAAALLERAIQVDPHFAEAYVNLATLRREEGLADSERVVIRAYLDSIGREGKYSGYMLQRLAELDSAAAASAPVSTPQTEPPR